MAEKDKQAIEEIFEDKRSFVHEGAKYFIDNATIDDVRQADWHYSRTYNEAMLAGVATQAQMQDILEEREIIGPKYEAKRIELIQELDEATTELKAATTLEEKEAGATKVELIRNRLFRWNQRASSPLSNCVEQMAEDARIEWLTACMVKDSDGNRVWKGYEDYKTTTNPTLGMRARYEVMLALQGLSSSFLDETPEALARKEIEEAKQTKLLEEEKVTVDEKPKKIKK